MKLVATADAAARSASGMAWRRASASARMRVFSEVISEMADRLRLGTRDSPARRRQGEA
jgi:hypothetical protein